MSILDRFTGLFRKKNPAPAALMPGELAARHTEIGTRSTPEQELDIALASLQPSAELRQRILDIRHMDLVDPRVKKIHERTARAACKGGLVLKGATSSKRIEDLWKEYVRRLELNRREKLESDMRGAMMEGSLPIQWVLDQDAATVVRGIRMPTETLRPLVNPNGQFQDPRAAYEQWDWYGNRPIARFPLWQLSLVRIRPDNYDNWACFGRPYLDSTRQTWRQLQMTERDLVIRRHTRAPQRLSHVLEGASQDDLKTYEQNVVNRMNKVTTDFFQNRKGGVTALQGDSNLDQIADVVHLLDTFMSGAPAPKGLFGYVGDLSRDILEDLKRDYYDELDALQDTVSFGYELGFRLDLLLHGINPDSVELCVQYLERRTETPTQRADMALKYKAIGFPDEMVIRAAGQDPAEVRRHAENKDALLNPYPAPNRIGMPGPAPAAGNGRAGPPRVSITPGNARKGESGTNISH
jgi:hypothetical protein